MTISYQMVFSISFKSIIAICVNFDLLFFFLHIFPRGSNKVADPIDRISS